MKMPMILDLQLFGQEPEVPQDQPRQEEMPEEDRLEQLHRAFESHFLDLEAQARQLQGTYPQLDLRRELRNPLFSRLTSPAVGLSVEDAYYTVHRRQLQAEAMAAAERQVANAIASGARRPRENGLSGQAGAVSAFDYRTASREQREAFKQRIRQAAAQGRKIYPRG